MQVVGDFDVCLWVLMGVCLEDQEYLGSVIGIVIEFYYLCCISQLSQSPIMLSSSWESDMGKAFGLSIFFISVEVIALYALGNQSISSQQQLDHDMLYSCCVQSAVSSAEA